MTKSLSAIRAVYQYTRAVMALSPMIPSLFIRILLRLQLSHGFAIHVKPIFAIRLVLTPIILKTIKNESDVWSSWLIINVVVLRTVSQLWRNFQRNRHRKVFVLILVFVAHVSISVWRWVHMVCALYIQGVAFSDVTKLTGLTLFEMPYSRWGLKVCNLPINLIEVIWISAHYLIDFAQSRAVSAKTIDWAEPVWPLTVTQECANLIFTWLVLKEKAYYRSLTRLKMSIHSSLTANYTPTERSSKAKDAIGWHCSQDSELSSIQSLIREFNSSFRSKGTNGKKTELKRKQMFGVLAFCSTALPNDCFSSHPKIAPTSQY